MIASGCYGNGEKVFSMYTEKNVYYDQADVDELGYEFDPEAAIRTGTAIFEKYGIRSEVL